MEAHAPQPSASSDSSKFSQIPADFPRPVHPGAVSGVMPKLLLVSYGGKLYPPGCTPPEMFERWDICEDLAQQLQKKCIESKAGKRSHMSETEILAQYLERLLKTGWGSDSEMRWVIRRTAGLLQWPVPPDAAEKDS